MKVLLFALARDVAGSGELEIDLAADATVADLRRVLGDRYPRLAPLLQRCAVAIDQEFAAEEAQVPPAAVVALLPPVSGG
jgi:molybdopterin converting factor subunit 1